jgi:N-acetylmuramoyl-L-alanine amidase
MNKPKVINPSSIIFLTIFLSISLLLIFVFNRERQPQEIELKKSPDVIDYQKNNEVAWKRPEGPLRVGLQAGHWKNDELPDELRRLRERGGGTQGGGKMEWEVNLEIAKEVASLLETRGIVVDVLPATIPEQYWADVVVAIHADGSNDSRTNGFKVAAPWRDITGKSSQLADLIEQNYKQVTEMRIDPNITRNMLGYYAFNWRRYRHAIHPMSTAVIIETGFLTNTADRDMLINKTSLVAEGISRGLFDFFELS